MAYPIHSVLSMSFEKFSKCDILEELGESGFKLTIEYRMEAAKGRQQLGGGAGPAGGASHRAGPPGPIPNQMTPQELHEAQSPQDQFSPDEPENHQGGKYGSDISGCIKYI